MNQTTIKETFHFWFVLNTEKNMRFSGNNKQHQDGEATPFNQLCTQRVHGILFLGNRSRKMAAYFLDPLPFPDGPGIILRGPLDTIWRNLWYCRSLEGFYICSHITKSFMYWWLVYCWICTSYRSVFVYGILLCTALNTRLTWTSLATMTKYGRWLLAWLDLVRLSNFKCVCDSLHQFGTLHYDDTFVQNLTLNNIFKFKERSRIF